MKTWQVSKAIEATNTEKRRKEIEERLLKNRGLTTKKLRQEFLNPLPPETLTPAAVGIDDKQLSKAVKRIQQAIKRQEQIIIYGDYDADGICSTAILWEALYDLGAKVLPFVPQREEHGYGLSIKGIETILKEQKPKLLITVDNGIVANDPVRYATKLGMGVIVTDHHQPGEKMPQALAIVHTTQLAGAGVAWMVAKAINPRAAAKSLDLAALATVADMVPLNGANRQIVKYGLVALQQTERVGLKALFDEAGIDATAMDTYMINFVIAPRLNATGRVSQALDAVRLVCAKKEMKARELAQILAETNRERQQLLETQLNHARTMVVKTAREEKILIVQHETYHQGIIGLIAGKLTEEFYRPSIVLSVQKETAKASARSIPGFNIIEAIREAKDWTIEAGGHPMAAGFSVAVDKIEALSQKLREIAEEKIDDRLLQPTLTIEATLIPEDITEKLAGLVEKLAPFGIGNPRPTFALEDMEVADTRLVGVEGKHLKLKLKQLPDVDVIGFSLGFWLPKLKPGVRLDLAGTIDKNVWNGRESLQLKLKDLRKTQS